MEQFVRDRITQMRLAKGVSEYQMSYDLGHSRGYIYNISSGKSLPSMSEFFSICEYFGISPCEFFNVECNSPILMSKVTDELKSLTDDDLIMIFSLIKRLKKQS